MGIGGFRGMNIQIFGTKKSADTRKAGYCGVLPGCMEEMGTESVA